MAVAVTDTALFNKARIAAGREPIDNEWMVTTIREGMRLDCGCEVVTANGHDYVERHWRDTCTAKFISWKDGETQKRYHVGDGQHVAGTIIDSKNKVFGSCNPRAGLFPHEL